MLVKGSERLISFVICTLFISALLLFAVAAQAQQVITDPANPNTVIRIENLPITLRGAGDGVYDVFFLFETAFDVYGAGLNDFDFKGCCSEDDAFIALIAINNVLNEELRVPDSAGDPSQDIFYMAVEEEDDFIAAVGGEFFGLAGWEPCEPPNCFVGTAIQAPHIPFTWARFLPAGSTGNQSPSADAAGPYTETVGNALTFDGSGSSDPDGVIADYSWDFGDGNTDVGETPTNIYATAGVYIVTLTVTDDGGKANTATTAAIIGQGDSPPEADAGGPYIGMNGVAVDFDGGASSDGDGNIVTWAWDFGDGSAPGSGETVSHTYTTDGVYAVTLTVTDDSGDTDSDQTAAVIGSVAEPPVADAGGPYTGTVNVAVNFDGSASSDADGDIVSWDWDFGDGSAPASGEMVSHTYSTSGQYDVTLTVTDDTAATDSNDTSAAIGSGNLPPISDAGGPYAAAPGVAVNFDGSASSDPEGGTLMYSWDFGDGNFGTEATPTHTYAVTDVYNVTLTVTDAAGALNSENTVALIRNESDLGIGQTTQSPNPALINGPITIGIPIDNNGPNDEPDARATVTLPANVTFSTVTSSQGSCSESMGNIDCALGPIANGGSATITVTVDGPPNTGPLTFGATVDGQNFDPDRSNITTVIEFDALASVKVQSKAEKGLGAFGVIEMLWLFLAAALVRVHRIRRTGSGTLLSAGILCALMLGSPGVSQAQGSDWYIGAGAGATEIDSDASGFVTDMAALGHTVSNVVIDDSSEGYKLFGGYNINEYFAAELTYVDLGEVTASFDGVSVDPPQMLADAATLLPVTADGFSVAALGRYPIGERWAIFAKLGAFVWEADLTIDITGGGTTGSTNPPTDGTDVMYGVGGDLYLGDNFGLRLEWERYALDPNDVDFVSASLLLRF